MRIPVIVASLIIPASTLFANTAQDTLQESAAVFQEIMQTPDKGIPQEMLEKAQCVIIVPSLKKGAFIVGGEYGRGFAECRQSDGTGWGAPAAVRVEGGSLGLQIGGSSTDVVMLVMSQRGMNKLTESKFTLGADAEVAAGPVGRTAAAATDLQLHAEILAWSRSRGAFAGISLKGATMRSDDERNEELYGHKMSNREVLTGKMKPPAAAQALISDLDRYSARKEPSNADRSK